MINWIFVRDVYFDKVQHIVEDNVGIFDWKDGKQMSEETGKYIFNLMRSTVDKGRIFQYFPKCDNSEKELRSKVETIIAEDLMSMYKNKEAKKMHTIIEKKK